MVAKILFIPFSVASGLIAAFAGKKLFDLVWTRIDDEKPPEAEHLETSWGKLVAANAIQGGIFRATRAGTDRGVRLAFYRFTGIWPGEKEPDEPIP